MEKYGNYSLKDFLSEPDFRSWILHGKPGNHPVWPQLPFYFPEKADVMSQAEELFLSWQEQGAPLGDAELERQVARILESTEPATITSHYPVRIWWRVAASVALLSVLSWMLLRMQKPAVSTEYSYPILVRNAGPELIEISNLADTILPVSLPDNSLVRLSPGSRISYPEDMHNSPHRDTREVYMTGEAFFMVVKNPERPFLVFANGLVTRVVGTSFTIRTTSDRTSVQVKSGRVAVTSMDKKAGPEILLDPNQQAVFIPKNNEISKSLISDPAIRQNLRSKPDFNFENTGIEEVFAVMQEAYGIPIVYDKTVFENCYLSVRLGDESFFSKLDIICQTIQAGYKEHNNRIMISGTGCD